MEEFLKQLYKFGTTEHAFNRKQEVTDLIFQYFDNLLITDQFELANDTLYEIDTTKITRGIKRSILVITYEDQNKLPNRQDFWERTYSESLMEFGPESTDRLFKNLM